MSIEVADSESHAWVAKPAGWHGTKRVKSDTRSTLSISRAEAVRTILYRKPANALRWAVMFVSGQCFQLNAAPPILHVREPACKRFLALSSSHSFASSVPAWKKNPIPDASARTKQCGQVQVSDNLLPSFPPISDLHFH